VNDGRELKTKQTKGNIKDLLSGIADETFLEKLIKNSVENIRRK